jgi:hypothetical protein
MAFQASLSQITEKLPILNLFFADFWLLLPLAGTILVLR